VGNKLDPFDTKSYQWLFSLHKPSSARDLERYKRTWRTVNSATHKKPREIDSKARKGK